MAKIKVVVVDDSALVRSLLSEIINRQPDMECVGTAADPLQAREVIRERNPDVITLDVEMPKMDGLEFLARLMRLRPTPVVMVSTLTEQGAETTLRALELGAVDFVAKPRIGVASGLQQLADDIVDKIRIAAKAHVRRPAAVTPASATATAAASSGAASASVRSGALGGSPPPAPATPIRLSTEKVICIGASTGGTEAIKEILMQLPADAPAVVITQHMPPGFTASFAARLDSLCRIRVSEARDGERILPGHAYIAPGGNQFSIARSGANYVAVVDDSPPVNRHKPSVEVLFRSCARVLGPNAIGVMLTGMGADGAEAMKEMRDAGAYNIAQDEASCVVFGMPKMAIQAGAVHAVLPLKDIARAIMERVAAAGVRHRI
ncbi:protein-glutamate methylesterase/protein-glutamine glutaminase [Tepidimonas aquatica]|uniref:Protein-glutamate methylesterase/protein-glutamine glutaminase n=1 Tax=Tepidimonas aquatica TaxID=247482 RepID=A0A554WNK4_9BURK|nr:chemotaxis response regulator protein-glutamate methylesterase [Tepidimonas aquatica]TSE25143.1 Chemotaxis response regulator protein-glutamate methylesterase [Tepidimonas aquatica]